MHPLLAPARYFQEVFGLTIFVCGFFKFFRSCHYKEQRKIFQFKLKYFINRMINYLQKNTIAIFFI